MIYLSNIVQTEGAVTEPVSLDEAKDYIRGLEGITEFDEVIEAMVESSRKYVESYTNLSLVPKAITLDCDNQKSCSDTLVLPYCTAVTTVVVNRLDSSDAPTLITAGTDYFLRGNTLRLNPGRYSISYTTVPNVTEDLKEAIKMDVADKFRGENLQGISEAAKGRAEPHRVPWL
jgi:hypothetical protein